MNVDPVLIVLLTGAKRVGFVGVLLAVAVPVRSWSVPLLAMLKGSTKVNGAADAAVLETFYGKMFSIGLEVRV